MKKSFSKTLALAAALTVAASATCFAAIGEGVTVNRDNRPRVTTSDTGNAGWFKNRHNTGSGPAIGEGARPKQPTNRGPAIGEGAKPTTVRGNTGPSNNRIHHNRRGHGPQVRHHDGSTIAQRMADAWKNQDN